MSAVVLLLSSPALAQQASHGATDQMSADAAESIKKAEDRQGTLRTTGNSRIADALNAWVARLTLTFVNEVKRRPSGLNYSLAVIFPNDPDNAHTYDRGASDPMKAAALALCGEARDRYDVDVGPRQPDPAEEEGSLWLMRSGRVVAFVGIKVERAVAIPNRDFNKVMNELMNGLVRSSFERSRKGPPPDADLMSSPGRGGTTSNGKYWPEKAPTAAQASAIIDEMIEQGPATIAYAVADEYGEVIATGGKGAYTQQQLTEAGRHAVRAFEEGTNTGTGQVQLPDEDAGEAWHDGGVGAFSNGGSGDHTVALAGMTWYEINVP